MKILRNRSLLTIGIAESVSGLGNWITMLAVFAIVVFRGDGGVAQSSGIFLAGLVPTLLASPLAGWLCDRYDRKWLMIGSQLLNGLAVSGLIFARRLELIYALLAVEAVIMAVMLPARQAVVPDLVAPEELTQANALLQQLAAVIKICGPMLAGLLLAVTDPHTAIVCDVISFALSALILSRLPALRPGGRHAAAHAVGDAGTAAAPEAEGAGVLAFAWRSPGLRLLFAAFFLTIVVLVGFDVLSAIMTRDVLRGNEGLFGLLVGLVGLGMSGSALLLLLRGSRRDPWRDVVAGLALLACLPAAAALAAQAHTPLVARLVLAAGCLAGGIGDGLATVQASTLLQQLAPPRLLGRLGGLYQSTATAGQLVGILATPLIVPGLLPAGHYFAVTTAGLAVLVLYVVLNLRRNRLQAAAA